MWLCGKKKKTFLNRYFLLISPALFAVPGSNLPHRHIGHIGFT